MNAPKRQAAVGYLFSATLHAGLISMVLWLAAPVWVRTSATEPGVETTVSERSDEPADNRDAWAVDAPDEPNSEEMASADRTSVDSTPSAQSPGFNEFARRRLEQARRQAEDKPPDEQVAELESLARQLSRVSSEQSVQEVAGTLSQWLGANDRPAQPATPPDKGGGEFDIGTAQISDVLMVETEQGVTYVAVLVDAQGNTLETPLDEADGPQLHRTFQLMKKFPLLETVYRSAVMGLLDKLAAQPPETGESEPPPASQADRQQQ